MEPTRLTLHTGFRVGELDPRVFGGFLEHMGRCVYEGVYDPESKHADEDGFRRDVMDALRRLDMTAMRYPGGNFASGYHWMDGIGPREARPTVRELAWQSREPNSFGTDEYVKLCRKMGWTPMITVNLGTGTPEEARDWVEYCNSPAGTKYADMRAGNASKEPYGVKLWCLGNEMDGAWQLGHVPAREYAIRAQQAAKMMKDCDKTIELVACGSCGTGGSTYMDWDREVLEYMGESADHLSIHRYVGNKDDDTPDYLAVTNAIDRQIEEADAVCRYVQARKRAGKRACICFDEWNVWSHSDDHDHGKRDENEFPRHLAECVYTLEDALVVAGFLHSFVRHADCVKIANIAQIVNVIAPVMTRGDDMLVQSIFHPFEMFSKRREGVSLRCAPEGPGYEGKTNGRVGFIDASAVLGDGVLHVFATNRSLDEPAELLIGLADGSVASLESGELVTGPGPKARNTFEEPKVVTPRALENVKVAGGAATVELPPLSVAAMTFELG